MNKQLAKDYLTISYLFNAIDNNFIEYMSPK